MDFLLEDKFTNPISMKSAYKLSQFYCYNGNVISEMHLQNPFSYTFSSFQAKLSSDNTVCKMHDVLLRKSILNDFAFLSHMLLNRDNTATVPECEMSASQHYLC